MATMKTISAALKLVDAKKENLRKAFEDLQSHSSPLSPFTLTWPDLDSYFSSLQSSLQHEFQILQSQQQQQQPQYQNPNNPPNSQTLDAKEGSGEAAVRVPVRAELITFCEKMDGLGLRKYIVERPKERNTKKAELADALGHAPDTAAMVLGARETCGCGVCDGDDGGAVVEVSNPPVSGDSCATAMGGEERSPVAPIGEPNTTPAFVEAGRRTDSTAVSADSGATASGEDTTAGGRDEFLAAATGGNGDVVGGGKGGGDGDGAAEVALMWWVLVAMVVDGGGVALDDGDIVDRLLGWGAGGFREGERGEWVE